MSKDNTIKCNTLMVGDWISVAGGFPMQVTTVGDDWCYADFDGNEGDLWEFNDDNECPHGIALTESILEYNGFHLRQTCAKHAYGKWQLENSAFSLDVKRNGLVCGCAPINSVHELQQALRLYGYKDIANNLKTK